MLYKYIYTLNSCLNLKTINQRWIWQRNMASVELGLSFRGFLNSSSNEFLETLVWVTTFLYISLSFPSSDSKRDTRTLTQRNQVIFRHKKTLLFWVQKSLFAGLKSRRIRWLRFGCITEFSRSNRLLAAELIFCQKLLGLKGQNQSQFWI